MTEGPRRNRDGGPAHDGRPPERRAPLLGDDLPQILEVFGSAPLVRETPGDTEAQADASAGRTGDAHAHAGDARGRSGGPQEWDPLDSVDEGPHDDSEPPLPAHRRRSRGTEQQGEPGAMELRVGEIGDIVRHGDARMGRLEASLNGLAQQSHFIPPKLRVLSKKVDEIAIAVGDVRVRALLVDLAGLADLVDGALKALPDVDAGALGGARRFFRALSTRIGQILESYDVHEIAVQGGFDPTVHNALDVQDVDDPALEGQIVEVVRPGYRTEHSVLRYAEVTVGRYRQAERDDEQETRGADASTRHGVRLTSVLGIGVDDTPGTKDAQTARRKPNAGASEPTKGKD